MVKKKPGIKDELNGKIRKYTRAELKELMAPLFTTGNPTTSTAEFNAAEDARITEALRRPIGLPGLPYPVDVEGLRRMQRVLEGEGAEQLTNPMTVHSEQDIGEIFRNMPVPSMMTAMFNSLPRAGDPARGEVRKELLFGPPAVGKAYLQEMLKRRNPKS